MKEITRWQVVNSVLRASLGSGKGGSNGHRLESRTGGYSNHNFYIIWESPDCRHSVVRCALSFYPPSFVIENWGEKLLFTHGTVLHKEMLPFIHLGLGRVQKVLWEPMLLVLISIILLKDEQRRPRMPRPSGMRPRLKSQLIWWDVNKCGIICLGERRKGDFISVYRHKHLWYNIDVDQDSIQPLLSVPE